MNKERLIRFAGVGLLCALLQMGFVGLFIKTFHVNDSLLENFGNLMGFILSAQINFLLSIKFTWQDRGQTIGIASWKNFNAMIIGALVTSQAAFFLANFVFPVLVATGLSLLISAFVNLVISNSFVFRKISTN